MANKLVVREATLEDRKALLEWHNDPLTQKMFRKNHFVDWDEHCSWFEKLLQDRNRILCVGLIDSQKIGNVRFDLRANGVHEVSINLNPKFRGKGYSSQILKESIDYLSKIRFVKKLFALVKKINIPSQKVFEKAGFIFVKDPEHYYPGMEEFSREFEVYCELNF